MDLLESGGNIPSYPLSPGNVKFVVAGESKRGWVTWLAGAIDDRIEALIPVTASSFSQMDGVSPSLTCPSCLPVCCNFIHAAAKTAD